MLVHGFETGRIVRLPGGEYIEVHQPVSESERWRIGVVDAPRALVLRPDERGRLPVLQRVRVRLSRFFFEDRIEVGSPIAPVEARAAVAGRADAAGGAGADQADAAASGAAHEADAAASADALSARS